jgi:GH18 family chitinase
MRRSTRILWFTFLACLAAVPALAQKKVVAYVPNWIDLATFSTNIDYQKLTHINVAFENPVNAAGDLSFNWKDAALIAAAQKHGVRILVSIGGGAASENKALLTRYSDLLSETNRARFVAKLADYVNAHGFDGLDVDLEGPTINQDYGAFIADLAGALKPRGKLLTAALSQGYGGSRVPAPVFAHFDFVNIMAYDAVGTWNPNAPGQHSSFEFAKKNVAYWLARGLPKSKAVLGLPFYGYGFGKDFRKSSYSYAEILRLHPDAAQVDEIGSTIWFNGAATIAAKTRYVLDEELAGVMIWSLNYDVPDGRSLLAAVDRTLKSASPPALESERR